MRDIKFRGYNSKSKIMYSAVEMGEDQLTISTDGSGFINVSGVSQRFSKYYSHIIPMQYTGIKDKNGAEIYEGDVLLSEITHIKYVVEFNKPEASFLALASASYIPSGSWKKSKVIGNIHQNPELLK